MTPTTFTGKTAPVMLPSALRFAGATQSPLPTSTAALRSWISPMRKAITARCSLLMLNCSAPI